MAMNKSQWGNKTHGIFQFTCLHLLHCSLGAWAGFWVPLPLVGVRLLGGLQLPELELDTFALRLWRLWMKKNPLWLTVEEGLYKLEASNKE